MLGGGGPTLDGLCLLPLQAVVRGARQYSGRFCRDSNGLPAHKPLPRLSKHCDQLETNDPTYVSHRPRCRDLNNTTHLSELSLPPGYEAGPFWF